MWPAAFWSPTPAGVLFALREDVVLLSDGAMPWLDVEAFEAACRRARRTRAPGDYRSADELYRGDLLPEDRFEVWAEAPREALRERRLGMLIEYAEVLSERREYSEVVEVVGAVTAADPFHEGAYRLLMTALAAVGRRYEALAAFDRLRESLTQELAADPELATRRLYRDLLAGGDQSPDAAMETEPATANSTARALSRPVATTAMTSGPAGAIGPDAAGALRVAAVRGVGSLILEQTSFVGRGREIAEIGQALGRTRLLTLTGPGGAGKTRLACEVAAGLVGRYPDGVHFAGLASLSRPELVAHMVAAVLDVPLPGTEAPEVALARLVADRRLLREVDAPRAGHATGRRLKPAPESCGAWSWVHRACRRGRSRSGRPRRYRRGRAVAGTVRRRRR